MNTAAFRVCVRATFPKRCVTRFICEALRSEAVTFLVSFGFWWLESCEEHRLTSIVGVLRLRAINPLLSDRSARRFAQDDGLVGVLKQQSVGRDKNAENQKSHKLSVKRFTIKIPGLRKQHRARRKKSSY